MGFFDWLLDPPRPVAPALKLMPLTREQRDYQTGELWRLGLDYFDPAMVDAIMRCDLPQEVVESKPVVQRIEFTDGQPQTFKAYEGQPHITEYFKAIFKGWRGSECTMSPQVFSGTAGGGKTLLAKVTAAEISSNCAQRGLPSVEFIEVFTSDVPNVQALDRYMRRVQQSPGCVFFIDELHSLVGKEHWYKFYLVLEEGRYLFEGEQAPVKLPPFTILGATTDFGELPEALRRRFMCHTFVRATYKQLLSFVQRTAKASHIPITARAAREIVNRMHYGGAPWEVIGTYRVAVVFAKARGSRKVAVQDVEKVWAVNQIDKMGLRPVDRQVIQAILTQPRYRRNPEGDGQEFVCYASSESNTYQMARVDRSEYLNYIRPKLMARGLLEIRITYGQALTARCLELYGHLRTQGA